MRLMTNDDTMETSQVGGASGFRFSGTRLDKLGATEYTLVTIAVDKTGSVKPFKELLLKCLKTAVKSCKKSPRSNNLLVRVIYFSSSLAGGFVEIHGFKPLSEINEDDYPDLDPFGGTPLYDAVFSAVGATNAYAKQLVDQEFLVNAIVTILSDGDDNGSNATIKMVGEEIQRGTQKEIIESLIGILVGVNLIDCQQRLEEFAKGAGLQFIDAGEATESKLAKVAQFVSNSISSQSQSLGTGGPSQNIAASI
jgi:hypothetical protein